MTRFILILLLVSSIYHTAVADNGYVLKGRITGNYSGYIFLGYHEFKDSTLVQNGSFEFKGKVDKPVHAWMYLQPLASVAWVYLENSSITIEATFKAGIEQGKSINIMRFTTISGSESQNLFGQYSDFCSANWEKESYAQNLYQELKRILTENPKHPVSGTILAQVAVNSRFTYDELTELSTLLDSSAIHDYDVRQIYTGIETLKKYGIGKPFFPFELSGLSGEKISLAKHVGKIILIDFWASWCGPCRAKHPAMLELQKKLQGKNFVIIGISLDKDNLAWRNAVTKDGITWTHAIDQDQKLMKEIGIQAIPALYLLNEKGEILGYNSSLEKIEEILLKLVK